MHGLSRTESGVAVSIEKTPDGTTVAHRSIGTFHVTVDTTVQQGTTSTVELVAVILDGTRRTFTSTMQPPLEEKRNHSDRTLGRCIRAKVPYCL